MHAVIDIGSNSILLLIARRDADGTLHIALDEARVARLSEGVNARGTLSDAAIERSVEILRDYRRVADAHHAPITALATEGLRMASDAERFLAPAASALGVSVQIVSGEVEASGSYMSVARELGPAARGPLRVVDVGGASTELVAGRGQTIEDMRSHQVGSVRLTERFVPEPALAIKAAQIEEIAASARLAFAAQPLAPLDTLHGVAGTVTTAAAILLGLERYDREAVDGSSFSATELEALRNTLAAQTLEQRLAHAPCLSPKRADVIVAGLTILICALEHCGATRLIARDRGMRYAYIPLPSGAGASKAQPKTSVPREAGP